MPQSRPVALVTGAGRTVGLAAGVVDRLAASGWDVGFTYWAPYDDRMPWDGEPDAATELAASVQRHGGRAHAVQADLSDPDAAPTVFDQITGTLGPVSALVMCHCESVDSSILDTTVESFDRHLAVNTRAVWLLVREFGRRFAGRFGSGRIVFITSDHTAFNLPYGASKGAADRIVLAAAREFADLGITANVINPGPIDTGWMSPELKQVVVAQTPLGRIGTPADPARLIDFLCSDDGGWINGQLLFSNGGISAPGMVQ